MYWRSALGTVVLLPPYLLPNLATFRAFGLGSTHLPRQKQKLRVGVG